MARSGGLTEGASLRRPVFMLHAGLDLSRRKIDVCLLSAGGEIVEVVGRSGDRLGAGVHDRRGDRRHQPVRHAEEALRLHRALSTRESVRRVEAAARRIAGVQEVESLLHLPGTRAPASRPKLQRQRSGH